MQQQQNLRQNKKRHLPLHKCHKIYLKEAAKSRFFYRKGQFLTIAHSFCFMACFLAQICCIMYKEPVWCSFIMFLGAWLA